MPDSRPVRPVAEPVENPSLSLRALNAIAHVYAKAVSENPVVQKVSPARPQRFAGYEFPVRVEAVVDEADGVKSLTLARTDGKRMPGWLPGAHIDVTLPSGRRRQYSLAGKPPVEDRYRIAVRRIDDGLVSPEIHALSEGAELTVRGPRNAFPMAAEEHYLFVAAGIGITPILGMIQAAAAARADWTLYYHGRTRDSMPFLAELEALAAGTDNTVIVASDDLDGVPHIDSVLRLAREDSALYVCGPIGLSLALRDRIPAVAPGVKFHTELFSPAPVVDGKPFAIRLSTTDEVVQVGATETALDAVRRARPDQAFSCRQGFCGACIVGMRSGAPVHRDRALRPDEQGTAFALCVSRADADSELVLDI
ncbi:PDR/VanB family oxidoreductase [Williamsia sp. CHRR-6]|uniref:PDR/VanB family oxidoreductase n=1 Tax=Williamsia sp. CHRR-6 TaxID=2835871 RepID=UPI001BDA7706|nr:PDR/VanB family oxidoreductase [Williamsia sp. CHRR-6]MBT0567251.1 oxidoreductase [Williamsia sp. CHRR-6]